MSGLQWRELSRADDFLPLNLIDNTDYWIKTRKVSKVDSAHQIRKNTIYRILKRCIIEPEKPDIKKALSNLMLQPQTESFLKR